MIKLRILTPVLLQIEDIDSWTQAQPKMLSTESDPVKRQTD